MKIKCKLCSDIIDSIPRILVMCECGRIGIDDLGSGHVRIIGDGWEIIDNNQ